MASHESQAQDLEQIMPLLVHGIEIGADGAEILRADERAKAAGDFLLHLGHTDGALAQIVGKWRTQDCHETQHLGSMFVHTAQQIEGQGLLDPAAALMTASWVAHRDNRCLRGVERTYSLPDLIISASAATTPLPLGRTNSGFTSISVIELPWSTISHESLCMASASASVSASELPR